MVKTVSKNVTAPTVPRVLQILGSACALPVGRAGDAIGRATNCISVKTVKRHVNVETTRIAIV